MDRKKYIRMQTIHTSVETENGFMSGSVVDANKEDKESISIENQPVGAESDYFGDESGWDY